RYGTQLGKDVVLAVHRPRFVLFDGERGERRGQICGRSRLRISFAAVRGRYQFVQLATFLFERPALLLQLLAILVDVTLRLIDRLDLLFQLRVKLPSFFMPGTLFSNELLTVLLESRKLDFELQFALLKPR